MIDPDDLPYGEPVSRMYRPATIIAPSLAAGSFCVIAIGGRIGLCVGILVFWIIAAIANSLTRGER